MSLEYYSIYNLQEEENRMKHFLKAHERGSAGVNAVIALIILGIAVYVGLTMVPIYSAHYKLEDNIKQDILFAQQRFKGEKLKEEFTAQVISYLDEMGAVYDKKNVRVDVNTGAGSVRVQLWYERPHKIPGFPKQFQLTVEGKYRL